MTFPVVSVQHSRNWNRSGIGLRGSSRAGDRRQRVRGTGADGQVPALDRLSEDAAGQRPSHAARRSVAQPRVSDRGDRRGLGSVATIASRTSGSSYGQSLAVPTSPRACRASSPLGPRPPGRRDSSRRSPTSQPLPALVELSFEEVARVEDVEHRWVRCWLLSWSFRFRSRHWRVPRVNHDLPTGSGRRPCREGDRRPRPEPRQG